MNVDEKAVSQEQINLWKAEYGHVYRTFTDDDVIYWRRIKRSEYTKIIVDTTSESDYYETVNDRVERMHERQNLIAKTVILYPEDADALLESSGGLVETISTEVMNRSGFSRTNTPTEEV